MQDDAGAEDVGFGAVAEVVEDFGGDVPGRAASEPFGCLRIHDGSEAEVGDLDIELVFEAATKSPERGT